MKNSAGILFYKVPFQVLLVHPSGNYNRNAKWSIPKGEHDLQKDAIDLWKTARREVNEELAILVEEKFDYFNLGTVVQGSSKRVTCFAVDYNLVSGQKIKLNWENDAWSFFHFQESQQKIHPAQLNFILTLNQLLNS